ncbi:exonuclease SbcC [Ruegeria intermedia]|uniref:Exonuclease SbcC n=1 Tax=Ruegeria intermedia TaxID=996115 RepID=A0A1M4Y536_9RHOB|nr:AAA family ATPase [Ruegeria intermedia]SHF00815.1 exonuclease SbcC [Ruegeria intermedia]
MKPVKLTLQAFGPYPNRVEIDFRDALEAGLFGIYGQTGSGKSTIFSAMTFALFGEAAREEQDTSSLRSDHADPGVVTRVEFIFEIGDRRYLAIRQPAQDRPKTRGEGMTSSAHEVWLFDVTGIAPDQIDADNRGKVIAERKVREVDEAIEGLLGYGATQFRQIVLLPQGRFEAFLSAKTRERAEILRDLFDVSAYAAIADDLKAEASAEENRIKTERDLCARQLAAEGFESAEALADGIADAEAVATECADEETTAQKIQGAAREALAEAEKVAEKFRALGEARQLLDGLQAESDRMAKLAEQVKQAERALSLRDVARQVDTANTELGEAIDTRSKAEEEVKSATRAAQTARETLEIEQGRAEEGEDLRRRLDELGRFASLLAEAEGDREALADAEKAEKEAKKAYDDAKTQLNGMDRTIFSDKQVLANARGREKQRQEFAVSTADLTAEHRLAVEFERAQTAVAEAQGWVETQQAEVDAAAGAAEDAKDKFGLAEQRLASAQALHLAAKLKPGKPCPVCGSCDHPAPAQGGVEDAGRDRAFRDAKSEWEQADRALQDTKQKLAGMEATLRDRRNRLSGLEAPGRTAAALSQEIAEIKEQQDALGPVMDIEAAEAALSKLEADRDELAQDCETYRSAWDKCREENARVQTSLAARLKDVPEALRDEAVLAIERDKAADALRLFEKARAKAEKAAQDAEKAVIGAQTKLEAAKTAIEKCQNRLKGAEGQFSDRLKAVGLTIEQYHDLTPAIETLEVDRETVTLHAQNVKSAEDALERSEAAVAGLELPDIDALKTALADTERRTKKATETRIEAEARHQHLTKLRDGLEDTLRKLDDAEQASGPLRNLAALVNGQNPRKVTLEIFAIWAMFDQVLEAANLRLGPMTSARYQLERDPEGGGRGAQGLGIVVLDTHTGRTRDTNTLSGGESFIAALSLALGLADVVESASGKVRLDTVFIDEGFGSLDAADGSGTLEQVLQVLTAHVSQNRAVGLISHVPQVQEAVPNGFYVRKGLAGSELEVRGQA